MNYIQRLADDIRAEVPADLIPDAPDVELLFYSYAVLLLAKGEKVTEEDVHNAWAAWMTQRDPAHDSIKPFSDLSETVQQEDKPFTEAIRQVARTLD